MSVSEEEVAALRADLERMQHKQEATQAELDRVQRTATGPILRRAR